ncbi:MAG: hypothetical protein ABIT20_15195 [Gemmatimonadaceae bacterium]
MRHGVRPVLRESALSLLALPIALLGRVTHDDFRAGRVTDLVYALLAMVITATLGGVAAALSLLRSRW